MKGEITSWKGYYSSFNIDVIPCGKQVSDCSWEARYHEDIYKIIATPLKTSVAE